MYHFMIIMIYALATPVILSAFAGLFLTWQRYKRQLLAVYLLLAFVIAQNVVFYGDMRFRAPIEPMLVLLAGAVPGLLISNGWRWLRARQQRTKNGASQGNTQNAGASPAAPQVLSMCTRNGTMQQI